MESVRAGVVSAGVGMVSVLSGVSGNSGTSGASGMESVKAGVVSAGVGMVSVLSGVSGNSGTSGASGMESEKLGVVSAGVGGERCTLCVSTQVGCKMGCRFCATGKQGFHGQLSAADILNQIQSVPESQALTNVVFMGMGEPFDNTDNVLRVLDILTAESGYAWSPKRVTVSTVGLIPGMLRFLKESQCHLAVSLHNPIGEERGEMMPAQRAFPIARVVEEINRFDFTGQRRVSFEYTLFEGVNDQQRHVDALVKLLAGLECRVNLIRFHTVPDTPYKGASEERMVWFRDQLNKKGITATIRKSRGEDILAACGLLSTKQLMEK